MTEKFLKLVTDKKTSDPESLDNIKRGNTKKATTRHIILKWQKIKKKKENPERSKKTGIFYI